MGLCTSWVTPSPTGVQKATLLQYHHLIDEVRNFGNIWGWKTYFDCITCFRGNKSEIRELKAACLSDVTSVEMPTPEQHQFHSGRRPGIKSWPASLRTVAHCC